MIRTRMVATSPPASTEAQWREQIRERPDDGSESTSLSFARRPNTRAKNVGTNGNKASMPKRKQPDKAVDEVEREGQNGVNENELGDVDLVIAEKTFCLREHKGNSSMTMMLRSVLLFRRIRFSPPFARQPDYVGLNSSTVPAAQKAKASR